MEQVDAVSAMAVLHRMLGIGQVVLAAVFSLLFFLGVAPLLPPDDVTAAIGWTFSGLALAGVVFTVLFLKPRVPERRTDESPAEYWMRADVREAVTLVWFLLEGAGVLAAVAFAMSGLPATVLIMLVAMAAFWMHGVARFGRRREWE